MITYSGNAGTYTVDQTVTISCSASDALSGVASTDCQDTTAPAYSFAVGTNTLSSTASDFAGNVGSGSVTFTIVVTPDSLSHLTHQFVSNSRVAYLMMATLTGVKWAGALGDQPLQASFVNTYIKLVNSQRGLTLTNQQADTLIRLASAL